MTFRIANARIPPPPPKPPIANAFLIELVSAAILCYTTIVTWTEADHVPPDNWAIEFCASVATLCVLMCIHDEDGVFPDLSPLVTLVQCAMGAYPTWSEVAPSSKLPLFGPLFGLIRHVRRSSPAYTGSCSAPQSPVSASSSRTRT